MRTIFSLLILFSLAAFGFAGNYSVDKTHSTVGFQVTHMVIAKVDGKFTDYEIDLTFDKDNPESFNVETTVKIASVNTENEKRDNHLKSPDFFDAKSHPDMVFKSNNLEKTDDGYVAHGTLTIRGVSKKVDLKFDITGPIQDPWGNTRIGVSAVTTINRHDFDVKWSKTMDGGGLVVGDDVDIIINAEFIKK